MSELVEIYRSHAAGEAAGKKEARKGRFFLTGSAIGLAVGIALLTPFLYMKGCPKATPAQHQRIQDAMEEANKRARQEAIKNQQDMARRKQNIK